uniref:BPTI/Kunitz inhibitor domain-containing protein n=1 Tax=Astyanax mexicanus TaxID=7994 RepID=A0A8B9K6G0_ASTMX
MHEIPFPLVLEFLCPVLHVSCMLLYMDSGTPCGQYVQRWYYDKAVGACSPFWYGGCSGNSNRFKTEFECINTCILTSKGCCDFPGLSGCTFGGLQWEEKNRPEDNFTFTYIIQLCLDNNDQGPCRAYLLKWFYDTQQNECARFWYGGCKGNGNRFDSQEECEDRCVTLSISPTPT